MVSNVYGTKMNLSQVIGSEKHPVKNVNYVTQTRITMIEGKELDYLNVLRDLIIGGVN